MLNAIPFKPNDHFVYITAHDCWCFCIVVLCCNSTGLAVYSDFQTFFSSTELVENFDEPSKAEGV